MRTWNATIHLQNGGRYWIPFEARVTAHVASTAIRRAYLEAMDHYHRTHGRAHITGIKITMFPARKIPRQNALPMTGLEPGEE